jgi:hypothetical protein
MNYSPIERVIGRILKRCPKFHNQIKRLYRYFNYFIFAEKNNAIIHPKVKRIIFPETNEHFFGYFDKTPWNIDETKILYHCVRNNGKELEMICRNLLTNERFCLGTSPAWNWQQGSMLQWIPKCPNYIIFNTISNNNLIAKICDMQGKIIDIINLPVQTIRSDGKGFISINYRRLAVLLSDYGYSCNVNNFASDMSDKDDGLFFIDIDSKKINLIVSIEYLKEQNNFPDLPNPKHKVNHAVYAPSGNKLVFMHRCLHSNGKKDRLYVVNDDGSNLKLLLDDGMISHYNWIDNNKLISYARTKTQGDGYYLIDIVSGKINPIAKNFLWNTGDGHPSMSKDQHFFITDTYPDRRCMQHLFLYFIETNKCMEIAKLLSPLKYYGEYRCDFHPRLSPSNQFISIDSVEKSKRIMTVFDISELLKK